jgi:hypothetical protein
LLGMLPFSAVLAARSIGVPQLLITHKLSGS